MEILVLIYLFHYHNTAVGRSDNYSFRVVNVKKTDGAPEKVEHDAVEYGKYTHKAPERHLGVKTAP
jgi:hypothetical protein